MTPSSFSRKLGKVVAGVVGGLMLQGQTTPQVPMGDIYQSGGGNNNLPVPLLVGRAVSDLHHGLSMEIEAERIFNGGEQIWNRSSGTVRRYQPACYVAYNNAHNEVPTLSSEFNARDFAAATATQKQAFTYLAQADACSNRIASNPDSPYGLGKFGSDSQTTPTNGNNTSPYGTGNFGTPPKSNPPPNLNDPNGSPYGYGKFATPPPVQSGGDKNPANTPYGLPPAPLQPLPPQKAPDFGPTVIGKPGWIKWDGTTNWYRFTDGTIASFPSHYNGYTLNPNVNPRKGGSIGYNGVGKFFLPQAMYYNSVESRWITPLKRPNEN